MCGVNAGVWVPGYQFKLFLIKFSVDPVVFPSCNGFIVWKGVDIGTWLVASR